MNVYSAAKFFQTEPGDVVFDMSSHFVDAFFKYRDIESIDRIVIKKTEWFFY